MSPVLVVGIGNRLRGDDAAGLLAADLLRRQPLAPGIDVRVHEGEPIGLLDLWYGYSAAIVLDALHGGAPAGTVLRFDAGARTPAFLARTASSHAISVWETIELGRTLGRLPERTVVLGVEGSEFRAGARVTSAVSAATETLAQAARAEAERLAGGREGA